jgi:hypothetical protein
MSLLQSWAKQNDNIVPFRMHALLQGESRRSEFPNMDNIEYDTALHFSSEQVGQIYLRCIIRGEGMFRNCLFINCVIEGGTFGSARNEGQDCFFKNCNIDPVADGVYLISGIAEDCSLTCPPRLNRNRMKFVSCVFKVSQRFKNGDVAVANIAEGITPG